MVPDYPEVVCLLMREMNKGRHEPRLPLPFPSRGDPGEIQKDIPEFFQPSGMEQATESNLREAKRRLAAYLEKQPLPSEGLEALVQHILEAQQIVVCMQQANRTRQLFNLKLGQPPNLDLPFPLD